MPKRKLNNLVFLHRDRGYRFADRDPDVDMVCSLIDESGLSSYQIANKVSQLTGNTYRISPATIDKWLAGITKRPQNCTLLWVMMALGYYRVWEKA